MSKMNPADIQATLAEIRERLAKMAQFGNLTVERSPGSHRTFVIVVGGNTGGLEANCGVEGGRNNAKAEFFASAPADYDTMLGLIDSLTRSDLYRAGIEAAARIAESPLELASMRREDRQT